MSETLTAQEMRNVQEMPGCLEMGELRKISTLQDVSLAEGEVRLQQANEEQEEKLKTNSLKRFFRLSSKKKSEDGPLEAEKSELEFEEALGSKSLSGSYSKVSLKSSLSGYWSSVFKSRKSKKSTKSNPEMDFDLPQTSSSINTENCLPPQTISNDLQDNVCDAKDTNVLEEIQSLNISEECPQK